MRIFGAVALVVALAPGTGSAATTSLHRAITLAKPGVVQVTTVFRAQVVYSTASGSTVYGPYQTTRTGSGFVVHPDGFVVTNSHLVQPSPDLADRFVQHFLHSYIISLQQDAGRDFSEGQIARLVGQIRSQGTISLVAESGETVQSLGQIPRTISVSVRAGATPTEESHILPAQLRSASPFSERDLALLEIQGGNLPSVRLGDSEEVQLQEVVTLLGYADAGPSTFVAGEATKKVAPRTLNIIQGVVDSFQSWEDGSAILGLEATTDPGNSGGPAINERGEVIGVLSMGSRGSWDPSAELSFLRPINVVKEFMRSSGIAPEQGLTDRRFQLGMERYWQAEQLLEQGEGRAARGEYEAAREQLESVFELYPLHPDAARFALRAEEAAARLPSGLVAPSWLLAGAGLLLVAAASLLLLRRKKGVEEDREPATMGRSWTLVGESGPLAGNRFPVDPAGLTIGRDPSKCQVVSQGETVSRRHARLRFGPTGLILTNLSTTNKTYLNDEPIRESLIGPGDRIRIGQVVFKLE